MVWIALIVSAWVALRQIYWWQVKEYRWDRWWSWMRWNGGWKELVRADFRRPVITGRALAIGGVWLGWCLLVGEWWWILSGGYVGPLVGIILTWPVYEVYRVVVTGQARVRVEKVRPKVVAITGSFGKTSGKEALVKVLAEKFKVVATLGNENTEIGVARRILKDLREGTEVLIVEMGAYRRGEIARLCGVAKPDVAWITGIGSQHVGLFGSMESLKKAKYEIVENLKKGGLAVFDKSAKELAEWAKEAGIRGKIGGVEEVVRELGVVAKVGANKELVTRKTPRGVTVIDDSYSTNEQGFERAMEYLKSLSGRKFVVSPGIIELGKYTREIHQKLAEKLKGINRVWVTNEIMAKYLGAEAQENPDRLFKIMSMELKSGDVLLIEGRIPSGLKQQILTL